MRGTTLLPFFVVATVAAGGCKLVTPGERSGSDGGCPLGETCSTATPEGLYFTGSPLSWTGPSVHLVWPVTAGGRETVGLLEPTDGGVPFVRPFVAESDTPSVATVGATATSSVELDGQSVGTARLRVLEPDGVALYDRVTVHVAQPTEIAVHGRGLDIPTPAPDGGVEPPHAVLFGGMHATFVVTPLDATGAWLVDEGSRVTTGAAPSTQRAFDLVDVTTPASGSVTVDAREGATTLHVTVPVVTHVEEIRGVATTSLSAGSDQQVCLQALAGGSVVLGDGWSFATTATAFTATPSSDDRGPIAGCVDLHGVAPGGGRVNIAFADTTSTLDVTVVAPGGSAAPLVVRAGDGSAFATRGERAGGE